MELVARQAGDRRVYPPVEFPLTDSQGFLVDKDRRRLPDRRRTGYRRVPLWAALYERKGRIWNRIIAISLIVGINAAFILLVYAVRVAFKN
jgi:hypothetical protein